MKQLVIDAQTGQVSFVDIPDNEPEAPTGQMPTIEERLDAIEELLLQQLLERMI